MSVIEEFKSECRLQVKGRTTVRGYWTFTIGIWVLAFICMMLLLGISIALDLPKNSNLFGILCLPIFVLGLSVTLLSILVTIRRLHDMGYSGWWICAIFMIDGFSSLLANFVPVISLFIYIAIFFFLSSRSDIRPNRFG